MVRIRRMAIISTATLGLVFSTAGIASAKSALSGAGGGANGSGLGNVSPAQSRASGDVMSRGDQTVRRDSDGSTVVDGDMRFAPPRGIGGFTAAVAPNPPVTYGNPTVLVAIINVGGTQKWPTPNILAVHTAATAFYSASSDNQLSPNFVLTTPIAVGSCSTVTFASTATSLYAAIRGAGYEPNNYDDVEFYTTGCATSGEAGVGTIGGRDFFVVSDEPSFATAATTMKAIVHEYGHNLGLSHASFLSCSSGGVVTSVSGSCIYNSVGDDMSPMGYFTPLGEFSAYDQWWLGWLGGGRIKQGKTGQYVLKALNSTSGLQSLAIPRADGSTLFIEYRQMTGYDAFLHAYMTPGISVRWARKATSGTALSPNAETAAEIRTRPVTPVPPNADDETIIPGQTWTTPEGDVTIQGVSNTPTEVTINVIANGAGVVSVSPDRVLDTRLGNGAPKTKVLAGGVVQVDVTMRGTSLVPDDAKAVVLNVTATSTNGSAFMTVWPCGEARPDASNINTYSNTSTPNAVITKIGPGGLVCIFAEQATDLIADVNGYYPANSSYHPLSPTDRKSVV